MLSRPLKNTIGESIQDNDEIYESDMIVPVSFGLEHKKMLSDLQLLFSNEMVAVPAHVAAIGSIVIVGTDGTSISPP